MKSASQLVWVLVVPLLLYAGTTGFEFVHADDADLIERNQPFLSDLRNVPRTFTRSYFEIEGEITAQKTYYRPMTIVSFMLDAARGGANPHQYHVTNVVLHAAAAGLLFALAVSWGAPRWAALAAALVFAAHPLNVQAVAWIAGRNDLLVALFGPLSMLAWLASCTAVTPRAVASAAIHVIAFGLAIFSKETGIVFPLLAVLHQRAVLRIDLGRGHWIALGCDGVLVGTWWMLRARALSGMPVEFSAEALRVALTNVPQLLLHAGKLFVPARLNVSPSVDILGLMTGAVPVTAFAWWARRVTRRGLVLLGACWALAFLLPTLLVAQMPVYEHRAYLPLMGILVCVAVGLADTKGRPFAARLIAGMILGALVVTFAAATIRRQDVFRDAFAYWGDGTRDARFGPIAHVNLGQLYEADGRPADARREYLRALQRDPNTPKAHNNLGVVLMALGEPELARSHFEEEALRHPWNADAWFNLGLWNETRGRSAAARRFYERAIAENRNYLPAYEKLGLAPPTRVSGVSQPRSPP